MNYNAYYAAGGAPPGGPDKPAAMYPGQGVLSASPPGGLGPSYQQQAVMAAQAQAQAQAQAHQHPHSGSPLARPPAGYPSQLAAQPGVAGYPGAMYHQPTLQGASPFAPGLYATASTLAMAQPGHGGPSIYAGAPMSQPSAMVATTTHGMHSMYAYPTYTMSQAAAAQAQMQAASQGAPVMPGYSPTQALHAPLSYPGGVAMAAGPAPYSMVSVSPYHRPAP